MCTSQQDGSGRWPEVICDLDVGQSRLVASTYQSLACFPIRSNHCIEVKLWNS
jgi:polynucleotide 5'-kinase involved in rRNA processing